jgi:hypothetical protein
MATEVDVRAIALSLPGTTEEQWFQTPGYKVAGKGFLRTDSLSCWSTWMKLIMMSYAS